MTQAIEINRETYDHYNEEKLVYKAEPGLTKEIVEEISRQKNEPKWRFKKRLKAFEILQKMPMPNWGPDLTDLALN